MLHCPRIRGSLRPHDARTTVSLASTPSHLMIWPSMASPAASARMGSYEAGIVPDPLEEASSAAYLPLSTLKITCKSSQTLLRLLLPHFAALTFPDCATRPESARSKDLPSNPLNMGLVLSRTTHLQVVQVTSANLFDSIPVTAEAPFSTRGFLG